MRLRFAHLITYSEALTLAGVHVPFTDIGAAVLRMLAATCGTTISDADAAELTNRFATMPPHPEIPAALARLRDHGFRLFTLTDNTLAISGRQLEHGRVIDVFERRFSVDETVKRHKPAPEAYHSVAAVLGVDPGGICLIACHVWDTMVLGGGLFEQGVLFVNQSVTSAILMIAVAGAATGSERLSDALVGGGVTLVITVIVFPAAPLPLIQHAFEQVFAALCDTLARLVELTGTREAASPEWTLGGGSAHRAPACRAPAGQVDRPPGRQSRAAPLAGPDAGPPGRQRDRTARPACCHRLEPGARQHCAGRRPAAAFPGLPRSP
jgi:2-haloalkanoic acid dehalogenase type II